MSIRPGILKNTKQIEEILNSAPKCLMVTANNNGTKTTMEILKNTNPSFTRAWDKISDDDDSYESDSEDW